MQKPIDREPVLTLSGVGRAFSSSGGHPQHVLRSVSFSLKPGEFVGIVGPSGAGKSTIGRIVGGLDQQYQGEVLDYGVPRHAGKRPDHIQLVNQDALQALNPRLSVRAILAEALAGRYSRDARQPSELHWNNAAFLYRWWKYRKTPAIGTDVLSKVGLDESLLTRRPAQLSGGQRQRLLIARALLAQPEILVLDEPVASQDSSIKARIANLLDSLHRTSAMTMLLISHDRGVVEYLCDRILELNEGYI